MKILWITNIIFPEPSKALGNPIPVYGGWMYGLAEQLVTKKEITLAVATVYSGDELKRLDLNGIQYYLLPGKFLLGYQKELERLWIDVVSSFIPDLVHIHGTEYQHGLACMRSCKNIKYIISIQGIVGVISRYYYAGLTMSDIFKNITLRDIIRRDTIISGRKRYIKRGVYEKEYISTAKHIIGRTEWDYAHLKAVNPNVAYHHCNETLRAGFYLSAKWDSKSINKYQIFLSQAKNPIKGLHQVLKAVALLIKEFPEVKVRIAGNNILNTGELTSQLKIDGYSSYIKKLIKRLGLKDCVKFTGPLSEENMIKEYLKANIFVCPSSIENSPNSVGEAQILGVPSIGSYVGGIPDMITHGETGLLYRFEEVEMLSKNIRRMFIDTQLTEKISVQSIVSAEKRHDRTMNCVQMIKIYKSMLS